MTKLKLLPLMYNPDDFQLLQPLDQLVVHVWVIRRGFLCGSQSPLAAWTSRYSWENADKLQLCPQCVEIFNREVN